MIHQENKSMKSIPLEPHFYTVKLGVYMGMGIPIFLIFAPKHRLWVLVRTASARQSEREPTIYVCVCVCFFLLKPFQLLQLRKNLYITWACFRNVRQRLPL